MLGGKRAMKAAWIILRLSLLTLLFNFPALAQTASTGAFTGEITDSNGVVVGGVQVTTINEATGEKRDVVSQDNGIYVVALLLPGSYRLEFTKSGFKSSVMTGLQNNVTETKRLDVELV